MSAYEARCTMASEQMPEADKARIREAAGVLAEAFGMTRAEVAIQLARGAEGSPFTPKAEAVYKAMEDAA